MAVVAARLLETGATGAILDLDSVVDLSDQVRDETLEWSAPADGDWRLFVFWMHGTGQTASPSASVNYTVNYLDRDGVDAVIDYWDSVVLTPELRKQIGRNPRAQMYMDSLELSVYGAGGMFWGRTVAREFRARRGYDPTPWLPFLVRSAPFMAVSTAYHNDVREEHRVTVEKVRFDYVRTLTDLYIENMLRPFAAFLHDNGITLRAEISYGLPFELTRPGPEVDGIETESLEFGAQIDAYRLLAGPAHLFGKQYSSETGATTRNHILDHRFYDQIIATQLAAGRQDRRPAPAARVHAARCLSQRAARLARAARRRAGQDGRGAESAQGLARVEAPAARPDGVAVAWRGTERARAHDRVRARSQRRARRLRPRRLSRRAAEAQQCYGALLAKSGDPRIKADAARASGDVRAANAFFQEAVKQYPMDAAVRARWGDLFLATHQNNEAAKLFEEALEARPALRAREARPREGRGRSVRREGPRDSRTRSSRSARARASRPICCSRAPTSRTARSRRPTRSSTRRVRSRRN